MPVRRCSPVLVVAVGALLGAACGTSSEAGPTFAPAATSVAVTTSVPVVSTSPPAPTTTTLPTLETDPPVTIGEQTPQFAWEASTVLAGSDEQMWTTEVETPTITSGPAGIDTINRFITDEIDNITVNWDATIEQDDPVASGSTLSYTQTVATDQLTMPTESLVSWVYVVDTFLGGAHGVAITTSYLFDAETGAVVELADVLPESALPIIQGYATTRITDDVLAAIGEPVDGEEQPAAEDLLFVEGLEPSFDNYRTFWPADDGLHVQFDPYDVGPYAIGAPEVTVPWDLLASEISADSPLAEYVS
jgi:hypothetical protein